MFKCHGINDILMEIVLKYVRNGISLDQIYDIEMPVRLVQCIQNAYNAYAGIE